MPLEKRKIERFDSKKYYDIIEINNWIKLAKLEKDHKSPFICWLLSEEGKEKECVERKKQEERSFNWIPSNWQQEIHHPPIFFSLPNEENQKWLAESILNFIQWFTYIAHCMHFPLCQVSMYITTSLVSPQLLQTKALIYKEFKRQQRQESLLIPLQECPHFGWSKLFFPHQCHNLVTITESRKSGFKHCSLSTEAVESLY